MEKPVLDFLEYLIDQCVKNYEISPSEITLSEFLKLIIEVKDSVGV
ncbi:MAG: hypothetical protein JW738_09515 [Actinobacteria bacterium]|nr:hypothetical protein [Actinomycetota bacterium]